MYVTKISGTKLSCALENDNSQWMLRIKLGDITEAEVPVTHMTKRALKSNLETAIENINLSIHDFQIDLIHKDLVGQIGHLLSKDRDDTQMDMATEVVVADDPRVDQLVSKVETLEQMIKVLEERISRIESMVNQ